MVANKVTYRNVFCALCNLKKLPRDFSFWTIGFKCGQNGGAKSSYYNRARFNNENRRQKRLVATSSVDYLAKVLPFCDWEVFPDIWGSPAEHRLRPCVGSYSLDFPPALIRDPKLNSGGNDGKSGDVENTPRDRGDFISSEAHSNEIGHCNFAVGENFDEKLSTREQKEGSKKSSYVGTSSIGSNGIDNSDSNENINFISSQLGHKQAGSSYGNGIKSPSAIEKLPPLLGEALSRACSYYQYSVSVDRNVILNSRSKLQQAEKGVNRNHQNGGKSGKLQEDADDVGVSSFNRGKININYRKENNKKHPEAETEIEQAGSLKHEQSITAETAQFNYFSSKLNPQNGQNDRKELLKSGSKMGPFLEYQNHNKESLQLETPNEQGNNALIFKNHHCALCNGVLASELSCLPNQLAPFTSLR